MGLKEQVADMDLKVDLLQTTLASEVTELKTAIDALIAEVGEISGIDLSPRTARIADITNRISGLSDLTIKPDTQIPTTPANLVGTASGETTVELSWTASTDNVGVASYEVFQNGDSIGSTVPASFSVSALTPGTTYMFSVLAKDKAGNVSIASAAVSVTTMGTPPVV